MARTFKESRKFNGRTYRLAYRADTKAEATDFRKGWTGYKRIVPAKMVGSRKVYLVYLAYK